MSVSKEELIINEAKRLGFSACGIVEANRVDSLNSDIFNKWLESGYASEMNYMHNNKEKRLNPTLLVENAKSIIIVAINYYPVIKRDESLPEISYYAYGKDYHDVIKNRLKKLWDFIEENISPVTGRIFTDSAPVLERYWAQKAGIGFIGKSNNLIIPGKGSYFFLGEIICDLELKNTENKIKINCGNCRKCIDACPTCALSIKDNTHLLDAEKCISYQTIENRGELSDLILLKNDTRVYGCDTCLKVCPFNKFAKSTNIEEFYPNEEFMLLNNSDLLSMKEVDFQRIFKGSAVKRIKYSGFLRNILAINK